MEDRKVYLNEHTNLLELEEHMYPLVDVETRLQCPGFAGEAAGRWSGRGSSSRYHASETR